jgi:hypothetical protein
MRKKCKTGPLYQGISRQPLGIKFEIGTKISFKTCTFWQQWKKTTCLKKEWGSSLNSQKVSRATFLDSRKWGCSGILSGWKQEKFSRFQSIRKHSQCELFYKASFIFVIKIVIGGIGFKNECFA